jgi:hypothetical protein
MNSRAKHSGREAVAEKRILAIITDITITLIRDAVESQQADLLQLFQHMLRDKTGFLEFLAERYGLMYRSIRKSSENPLRPKLQVATDRR